MTLNDELKILDDKIKSNQVQYNLEAPKNFPLWSKESDKYEYLIYEYLAYKPGVVKQAKLEYSPLGKVSNKGF